MCIVCCVQCINDLLMPASQPRCTTGVVHLRTVSTGLIWNIMRTCAFAGAQHRWQSGPPFGRWVHRRDLEELPLILLCVIIISSRVPHCCATGRPAVAGCGYVECWRVCVCAVRRREVSDAPRKFIGNPLCPLTLIL